MNALLDLVAPLGFVVVLTGGLFWWMPRLTRPELYFAVTVPADLKELGPGQWRMRQVTGVEPYESRDPDTRRVWWSDAGVHQNITFPVHPDPVSGMHCWHQLVRVERASPED